MKKVLKIMTVLAVLVTFAGMVIAYIKTDKFLDALGSLQTLADRLNLTRWSKNIDMKFYDFMNKGYLLNLPSFAEGTKAYNATMIIGAIMVLIGIGLVSGSDSLLEKLLAAGILSVPFAALFGMYFVLAVILLDLVVALRGGD